MEAVKEIREKTIKRNLDDIAGILRRDDIEVTRADVEANDHFIAMTIWVENK